MAEVLPADLRVPRLMTGEVAEAEAFFADAVARGHEGVVVKSLDAPYAAGRRGSEWIKVKPRHTLDLVVLAAEWGHGRRRGWLSNLHLGARDPAGGFVMLGKTFKGLTDEMLRWQTERFLDIAEPPGQHPGVTSPTPGACCGSVRRWWSRSPSTASRPVPGIRAGWRCASPVSSGTGQTSRRPRRIRSTRSAPSGRGAFRTAENERCHQVQRNIIRSSQWTFRG